ncbi:hypothetical protein KM043_000863 [Ampulex compressa]|nr:hypothetical protein KM043_000863 [Ampulex compressa]
MIDKQLSGAVDRIGKRFEESEESSRLRRSGGDGKERRGARRECEAPRGYTEFQREANIKSAYKMAVVEEGKNWDASAGPASACTRRDGAVPRDTGYTAHSRAAPDRKLRPETAFV